MAQVTRLGLYGGPRLPYVGFTDRAVVISAILSGSVSDGVLESQLASSWEDAVIILDNATWVSGQNFNDARQSIIDGFDSAGSETFGWNAEIRDKLNPVSVFRVSDTQVRLELNGFSGYSIDANETIQLVIPNSAFSGSVDVTALPTFDVTADTLSGTEIVNADTTFEKSNYLHSDRSNFRYDELKTEWTGSMVGEDEWEPRHPQDFVRARGSQKDKGPQSPEDDNNFLSTPVSGDDL